VLVDPQGVMGSGEKQTRIKATPEVITLIENAVEYVTTHRMTTRPFQRGRVRDAVAAILGVGSATVARVESGKLVAEQAKPAEKPSAKRKQLGRAPLEQVAKRVCVRAEAGWDIVDACRDIIAEVNSRVPSCVCTVGLVVRELYARHPAHMKVLDALYQLGKGAGAKGYAKPGAKLPVKLLRRCLARAGFAFDVADTKNVLAERENHVKYRNKYLGEKIGNRIEESAGAEEGAEEHLAPTDRRQSAVTARGGIRWRGG
jgi:hypothetical protein